MVGPRRFRHRLDAVDLRHPGLHAAARPGTCARLERRVATPAAPRLALFDLDGTLLAGDTDVLWCEFLIDEGVLDRADVRAANRDVAERYAPARSTPAEFAAFYAATLAGRSPTQWAPLRERFVATLDRAADRRRRRSTLVARHRDAGDRLVLTTATNRFLTAPIAALLGIDDLIATELEVAPAARSPAAPPASSTCAKARSARLARWLRPKGWPLEPGGGDVLQRLDQRPAAAAARSARRWWSIPTRACGPRPRAAAGR